MTTITDRFYIRCADCLSIGVIEGTYQPGWHCSLCSGPIELMGKVVTDTKVEVEHERSACDKRCTHAVGPLCVCKCQCANHGTGRVVTVKTVENITKVQFVPDEVAVAKREHYVQTRDHLVTTLHLWQAIARDYSKPYGARRPYYGLVWPMQQAVKKAVEARTWKARDKHLAAAQAIVTEASRHAEPAHV